MISKELLDILACPVCKAGLVLRTDTLKCTACGRVYPIRDDIPILLEEAAKIEQP